MQVYGLLERGAMQRATGTTKMNELSSRSHAVFIIIIEKSTVTSTQQADGDEMEQFRGLAPGMVRYLHYHRQPSPRRRDAEESCVCLEAPMASWCAMQTGQRTGADAGHQLHEWDVEDWAPPVLARPVLSAIGANVKQMLML